MSLKFFYLLWMTIPLGLLGLQGAASAQLSQPAPVPTSILPATSDTTVIQQSNQIDILGGQSSSGAAPNVVHQFQEFNLGAADAANFVVNPDVANVISLIDALQPSTIDGLLKLTSSDPNVASAANLFLVNPAGIVFGENMSLNLPTGLTATTASGLLFEDLYRLSIDGSVSEIALPVSTTATKGGVATVQDLTGDPNGYFFATESSSTAVLGPLSPELPSGSIHNQARLQVSPQASITLIGSYVQNDGELVAPGGTVNLVAVSGDSLLRLTQTGGLLSLDLIATDTPTSLSSTDIPLRLTGGGNQGATQIEITSNGSQLLTSTPPLTPDTGKVLVRGTIDVSDDSNQGNVNIVGEQINLIGSDIHADSARQAGTISIGDGSANSNVSSEYVLVDRNSTLSADSTTGSGGVIQIRATDTLRFYGEATATGANSRLDGTVRLDADENLDIRKPVAR
ncbi:filamentous hemagglutinin N-terminal domain-containing protein [Leptolyngbya cf. ectocarpi LEGE 11479]|uniref:Filamentous hemagglutinin N-terminal domain-containing protein n=1 Tax=Leptolyngbya cf. ectocarpi LEGE 11479 TaxID=1828722 RepID=A0A928X2Z5_LEPEC|nr:filamentous hemagglutinin N-terminal domain-containing protein [Leptolyngbya ectocarpi]MBE9066108.1 filamentous hemagglutinin N-terminal domain-containing protein [Leptolyngbya cf. ectocarpi LEGE 11479]